MSIIGAWFHACHDPADASRCQAAATIDAIPNHDPHIHLACHFPGVSAFAAEKPVKLLLPAGQRPNILMIVIDDIGYGDLSVHGHPWLKTPNLDRLHAQSARMTDFLVSPTCAPTRAALMTGAHEFRSGVTHTIHGMERMNRDCTTLPQLLERAGYRTGIFGKWHLGDGPGYEPWNRGFQEAVIAENDASAAQHKPVDPMFLFSEERRQTQGTRDILFAEEAMRFMKKEHQKPFFCYFATYDPHKSYWAEPRFMEEMQRQVSAARKMGILGVSERRLGFFAEVLQTDWIVGQILDFLDAQGLAENTLVLLMGDNGGTDGTDAYNAGMRGHKTTAWVGGTRTFAFWRLPGVLEPRDITESCAHIDVLPTLAEAAGAELDADFNKQVEGRSAWRLLTASGRIWPERYLHAHVARWERGKRDQHRHEGAMVRRGDFDLVRVKTANAGRAYTDRPEFHRAATPGGDWALYNRIADPLQEKNLAADHPDLVKQLSTEFERWWDSSRPFLVHEAAHSDPESSKLR